MKRVRCMAMVAALMAGCLSEALASGDYGPAYSMFRAWTMPDIALARFQAGDLGVIQPGMRRVYLYTAWRAVALGPRVAAVPGSAGGLARADGSAFGNGWAQAPETDPALTARLAAALQLAPDTPQVRAIGACAPAATAYAATVFTQASSRPDAVAARLDAWILNQQKVGEACRVADDWRYRYGTEKPPVLVAPAPLAASEPAYWRQLNEYQRAAWAFQAGHYADSTPLFERIGASADHPMRGLGAYLALRSEVRRATAPAVASASTQPGMPAARPLDLNTREQQALALERRGAAILADGSLAPVHEPTRALLRSMRAKLTPETRIEELNRALADPAADPFVLDQLGDWSILMNQATPAQVRALRGSHEFIDWIETVRGCTGLTANADCEPAGVHALARWRQGHSRPWLVAALMLPQSPAAAADLMQAGLALPPEDPAYVTVRYHLARLNRLAGKPREAQAIGDAMLQRQLSPSARNLFRQERLALAATVPEGARFLLRTNVDSAWSRARVPADDTMSRETASEIMLDDDGLAWVNQGLPVAGLIELARQPELPPAVRTRVAGAAWLRATMLDEVEEGRQAGALLAQLAPSVAAAVARHAQAASTIERRHIALLASVRFGLTAQMGMYAQAVSAVAEPDATASAWCSFKPTDESSNTGIEGRSIERGFSWRLPPMPDTGRAAQRQAELARLGSLKTATGVTGDDVLAWAASHPADPELPWMLHMVVMSTRGGCLDPDVAILSRTAWGLLHKRFPDNAWTRQTPYFYSGK
jgi:hypothetical protein